MTPIQIPAIMGLDAACQPAGPPYSLAARYFPTFDKMPGRRDVTTVVSEIVCRRKSSTPHDVDSTSHDMTIA